MNHNGFREHRIRGSLERAVGEAPMERDQIEAFARRAWIQNGTVTALPWQPLSDWDRATLNAIGARLYGPRLNGG
jgi:hypothetical protein